MKNATQPKSGVELLDAHTIIERIERWIRVQFNGEYVADTKNAYLMRRGAGQLAYYFPEADVKMKHLVPRRDDQQDRKYFDVRVKDQVAKGAAWKLSNPLDEESALKDYFAFHWNRMDHWFEEEEEVIGHPRDPYHRVDIRASSRSVRVELNGTILADSIRSTVVFETGLPARFYLPREDVDMDKLETSSVKTICPYKGQASYWSALVEGERFMNLAWCYEVPLPEMSRIAGLLSFFNEKVDLFVDSELQERPITPWS